jgi:prepilin-type N-terminal cleavage/methylation domain-containing protein
MNQKGFTRTHTFLRHSLRDFTTSKKYVCGFTLIESLVGIAIFLILTGVVYQTLFLNYKDDALNWNNTTISSLASQYMETARNIPYAQIGTIQGNPHGNLPDASNPNTVTVGTTTYQVYFEVTYIDDPADGTALAGTDPAPDDYKQVKLTIKNTLTNSITNFTTNMVPSGLENLASGGALSISVINAVGQPVPDATINITNNSISPSINLSRMSDANGKWIEVGLPDSSNSYHIVVTKNSYSTDQTYPITGQNPSPTKGDATIANGQVTQISFSIDQTSNLTFNTLGPTCNPIAGVGLEVKGAKLIGTPNVVKYDNTFSSNSSGQIPLANIEWDDYTPALTGNTYMIYGSSPIQQINLLPATSQLFNLILGTKTTNSLLVIVKDSSTGNPLEGATVQLTNASPVVNTSGITGGSLWSQQYWNGGSGQAAWNDTTKYWSDDGGISTTGTPLAMRLINSSGHTLVSSGSLISSTFDTGSTATTYTTLNWQPTSQDPADTVKFQIATNNDNSTWNFLGPDGTNATYYTTPNTSINTITATQRYIRYEAFLSTTNTAKNPTVTSVGINYVSGCFTPGQVIFPGLTTSGNYQVTVSLAGYTTKVISNLNVSGYQTLSVSLTHS